MGEGKPKPIQETVPTSAVSMTSETDGGIAGITLLEVGSSPEDAHNKYEITGELTREVLATRLAEAQRLWNLHSNKGFEISGIQVALSDSIGDKLSDKWLENPGENDDDRSERVRFDSEFGEAFIEALENDQGTNPETIDRIFQIMQKYKK